MLYFSDKLLFVLGCGQVVKAADSDSATEGSNPSTPAKKKHRPLARFANAKLRLLACFFFSDHTRISLRFDSVGTLMRCISSEIFYFISFIALWLALLFAKLRLLGVFFLFRPHANVASL